MVGGQQARLKEGEHSDRIGDTRRKFCWALFCTKEFKVARAVNLELGFTDYSFYNLVILIKLCKIRYLNLDQALLFIRNQVHSLKN